MQDKLSHADQYKLLREELMQAIRESFRTEFWAGAAVGVLYGWLIQHKQEVASPAVWFIGPVIVLICGVKCLRLFLHMGQIASYLKRIEEHSFGNDAVLPGWERFFEKRGGATRDLITAVVIWSLMLVLTILGSCILSHQVVSPPT
jgi:hypothetical protein